MNEQNFLVPMVLKTNLPYEWPVERRGIVGTLVWVVLNLVTAGSGAPLNRNIRFLPPVLSCIINCSLS